MLPRFKPQQDRSMFYSNIRELDGIEVLLDFFIDLHLPPG